MYPIQVLLETYLVDKSKNQLYVKEQFGVYHNFVCGIDKYLWNSWIDDVLNRNFSSNRQRNQVIIKLGLALQNRTKQIIKDKQIFQSDKHPKIQKDAKGVCGFCMKRCWCLINSIIIINNLGWKNWKGRAKCRIFSFFAFS